MKKIIPFCATFLLTIIFSQSLIGQAPAWKWAKSTSTDSSVVIGIDVENAGNSVVAGTFSAASQKFGTLTLTNSGTGGSSDAFLVKYDSLGNVLWAKNGTGSTYGGEQFNDVAVDNAGNIYVCGFSSSDQVKFGNVTLQKGSGIMRQLFIVKFDKNGTALWGKNILTNDFDNPEQIAVDNQGNVYCAGLLLSSLTFGTGGTVTANGENVFVVKYNTSGTYQWVRASSGISFDRLNDICVDGTNNVYIIGTFIENQFRLGGTTFNPLGDDDSFLAKFSTTGSQTWVRQIGSTGYDQMRGVTADANGNVWIAGLLAGFMEELVLGEDTIPITHSGILLVAKYDSNGNVKWARSPKTSANIAGDRIATDGFGYVWVSGTFIEVGEPVQFGMSQLTSTTQGYQTYVAKYDPAGNALWGVQSKVTSDASQSVKALEVDNKGFATVGGYLTFNGNNTFGSTIISSKNGKLRMFAARVGADNLSSIGEVNQSGSKVHVYPNPNHGILHIFSKSVMPTLIRIYDHTGKLVLTSVERSVNLQTINPGFYTYVIYSDEVPVAEGKLILE